MLIVLLPHLGWRTEQAAFYRCALLHRCKQSTPKEHSKEGLCSMLDMEWRVVHLHWGDWVFTELVLFHALGLSN
jgi:hypothetical protein